MSVTDPGKWSCPSCHRTITVFASEPDQRAAIDAIQRRHSKAHREASAILSRLGLPESHPPRRQPKRRAA